MCTIYSSSTPEPFTHGVCITEADGQLLSLQPCSLQLQLTEQANVLHDSFVILEQQ